MKIASLTAIVIAAAVVAGCAGSQIGASQDAVGTLSHVVPAAPVDDLNGETFSTKRVSANCEGSRSSFYFKAAGRATGPFPGSFRAFGLVASGAGAESSVLSEEFAIRSGSRTISGRATASGTAIKLNCVYVTLLVSRASYQDARWRGRTQLQYGYPKEFSQSFQ
jgi:hypothetical protein